MMIEESAKMHQLYLLNIELRCSVVFHIVFFTSFPGTCRPGPNRPAAGGVCQGGGAEPFAAGRGQLSAPGPRCLASCLRRGAEAAAAQATGVRMCNR